MESKFKNTKTLEKEKAEAMAAIGTTTRSKPVAKDKLIGDSRAKFRENLKEAYLANKDSKELPPSEKPKPKNDILKKNMNMNYLNRTTMEKATAEQNKKKTTGAGKPKTAETAVPKVVKKAGDSVNIELAKDFTIVKDGPGMFSQTGGSQIGHTNINITTKAKTEKKKNARELLYDEVKEFVIRPNKKLEKQLQDKCIDLNINFS